MDYKPKSTSKAGIAEANGKAERYRFLNQPEEAESICLDVLAVDPVNQLAWRNLGLAITDPFTGKPGDRHTEAELAFEKLSDNYERLYYMGIMHERIALRHGAERINARGTNASQKCKDRQNQQHANDCHDIPPAGRIVRC